MDTHPDAGPFLTGLSIYGFISKLSVCNTIHFKSRERSAISSWRWKGESWGLKWGVTILGSAKQAAGPCYLWPGKVDTTTTAGTNSSSTKVTRVLSTEILRLWSSVVMLVHTGICLCCGAATITSAMCTSAGFGVISFDIQC